MQSSRKLLLVVLVVIFDVSQGRLNFGSQGGKRFPIPSELACEGYPIVLRCPGTDVIEVVSAQYGRQNADTCATSPERMRNTACHLPEAFDIMSTKCNNKTQCKLVVSDDNFPNPCPGTHKYLQATFRCVKYMFGCPGSLTGIGSNITFSTFMHPEAGSWSKDAIYNPNHVFYVASSQQSVQEYESTEQFVDGDDPVRTYELPSRISGTSYVIYDGNMFYVKAQSRAILKYSFLARIRMREGSLPGRYKQNSPIELAVDEEGLWVIYTNAYDLGRIVISRLNKDTLQLEKTWRTTYLQSASLHTIVTCGVLYVVGKRSGEIEYMYNTNADSRNGRFVSIGFDRNRPFSPSDPAGVRSDSNFEPPTRRLFSQPAGIFSRGRTFRSYNFTSLMYNPRDRLLYAWDASHSKAVFYKLHFGSPEPSEKPTTTTTTRITRPTTTVSHTPPGQVTHAPTPTNSPTDRPPQIPILQRSCPEVSRNGINWPTTNIDTTATMPCPNNIEGNAAWRCISEKMTSKAIWAESGADMSSCVTWINDIENRLKTGHIDAVLAADSLSRGLSTSESLSSDDISSASSVMKDFTSSRGSSMSLTVTEAKQLADDVLISVDKLLDENNEADWMKMNEMQRYETANDILSSVESSGNILSESLRGNLLNRRSSSHASESVEKPGLLLHVNVQRTLNAQTVVFPDATNAQDRIEMPRDNIISMNKQGVTSLVFTLYDKLGNYMEMRSGEDSDDEMWNIDSRLISASNGEAGHDVQLGSDVIITLQHRQIVDAPRKCVYWDYSQNDRTGKWSTEGCHVTESNSTHTQCACSHVTCFAVLVNVAGVQITSRDNDVALQIVTYVGISVSLLCLLICIFTFTVFRNLQSDRNTIHKHLCLSLFVAEAVFLVGINQTSNRIPCAIIAGVLHYAFLAAFVWLALEGFQLYVMLVEVFEGRSRWKWYYVAGYGIPAVIVAASAAVDVDGYGGERACWLKVDSGFIWSFVGPVSAVIFCNLVFLSITIVKMYRHTLAFTDLSKINNLKASVRGASVFLCLLGITWAFGILWLCGKTPIMAYLFCVFNAFQGLFLFVFHCLLQKKVRNEYNRCFARSSCCANKSQEAYVSNSMSFSKQYTPARYSTPNTHNATITTQAANSQSQLRRMWNETMSHPSDTTMKDANTVSNRDPSRVGASQRRNHQSPPLTKRVNGDRLSDVRQDVQRISNHEDEVFLPTSGRGRDVVVAEDAYDHLQRHCHPNDCAYEHHDVPCHAPDAQCNHMHHTNTHHDGGFNMQPRPHPRSLTMNHIKSVPHRLRSSDKEDVSIVRRQEHQRASTLCNTTTVLTNGDWERRASTPTRRFSQPVRHVNDNDVCPYHMQEDRCSEAGYLLPKPTASTPPVLEYRAQNEAGRKQNQTELHHQGHRNLRRRSMTSSESDDPVVNDFSASSSAGSSCGNPSSLTRTICGRPAIVSRPIAEDHDDNTPYGPQIDHPDQYTRHRDAYTGVYRDENDLEVQRITGPDLDQIKLCNNDSQRDSAFYQSMPDVNSSPMVNYSSNSSGCSPVCVDSDVSYHMIRPSKNAELKNPRYVLAPVTGDFKPTRVSNHKRTDSLHDDKIQKHQNEDNSQNIPSDEGYERQTHSSDYQYSTIPQSHHYDDEHQSKATMDSTGRMMTCL